MGLRKGLHDSMKALKPAWTLLLVLADTLCNKLIPSIESLHLNSPSYNRSQERLCSNNDFFRYLQLPACDVVKEIDGLSYSLAPHIGIFVSHCCTQWISVSMTSW